MFEHFINGIKNAWRIFVTCLIFIRRDKSLLIVPVLEGIASVLFVLGIWQFLIKPFMEGGKFTAFVAGSPVNIYILIFGLLIIYYIIITFLNAAHCWMVYEVAQEKDATLLSGLRRAAKNAKDILLFSIALVVVKVIIGAIHGQQGERRGFGIGVARSWLGELMDMATNLAAKLVVPAMIVTEKDFIQSVKQLRKALPRLTEIVVGAGLGPLMMLVYVLIVIAVILLSSAMPTFFPIFVAGGIIFAIILGVMKGAVEKTYYTLLYLTLIEKKKIKGLSSLH